MNNQKSKVKQKETICLHLCICVFKKMIIFFDFSVAFDYLCRIYMMNGYENLHIIGRAIPPLGYDESIPIATGHRRSGGCGAGSAAEDVGTAR
jgi:hypothetical protein